MSLGWHNRRMSELRSKDNEPKNAALKHIMAKKDAEMAKEFNWAMKNICPRCYIVLTKTGECSMGCGFKK